MNLIIAMRKFQLILFGCIAVWMVSRLAGCSTVKTFNEADAANNGKPAVKITAGSLTDWPYAIRDIIAHGKTVYIATDEYGLQIMDVSDPAHPSPRKTLHFFERQRDNIVDLRYPPRRLHIHDQTLYVVGGCFPGRVFALDITDPTAVVSLGTHGLTGGSAIDTTVDKISVADNYSGLPLLDRTDPMMTTLGYVPRREDTLAINGAIDGNFAFVRMWNAGFNTTPLYLVEITDPLQTVVRETIQAGYISPQVDGNDTLQLFRHRNQLYQLTTQWLIIRPIAPNAPSRIVFATKELFRTGPPKVTDLFVTDNYLYLIGPDIGLAILDLAKPDAVHITGAYTANLKAASVLWIEDNLVFIGDHKAGFQILDVTQPSDPQLLYPVAP